MLVGLWEFHYGHILDNITEALIESKQGQLSFLMKHHYHSPSCVPNTQESRFSDFPEECHSEGRKKANDNCLVQSVQNNKVRSVFHLNFSFSLIIIYSTFMSY